MKTNQVITRPMGPFQVLQRTKDGFFNATDLLKQWNTHVQNGSQFLNTQNSGELKKKDMDDYMNNKSTSEFISTILMKEKLSSKKLIFSSSRGRHNGGTWMHPMLFIDFAMWLNPSFKYDVIRFVSDELISLRDKAGDEYKELSKAVYNIVGKNNICDVMNRLSRSMNIIVYGKHEQEIRNKVGVVGSMRELAELEHTLAQFIKAGFVKNEDDIRTQLNRFYYEKYPQYKIAQ